MTSSWCSCHHVARTWPRWPPGPSNEAYLSSPFLETFRACSSPAPTPFKPQPAPAILSQESVQTTLSITHHTWKRPSIGPRTTHGPQSPPWWVHWQHTYSNLRDKKGKETNKKKLQQAIESQRKAKRKITWRRQVSDPLGKGNGSTHPRQNYAQAKSANHQTKALKPQRAPPAHMQAPPEPMQLPLDECLQTTTWNIAAATASLWLVRQVTFTGQTGGQDRPAPENCTGQTDTLHRSGRCHLGNCLSSKNSKSLGNLLNMCSKSIQVQTSPLVDNAWIKPKIGKWQPRASQIEKIQHSMLHMSK
jgi:hypothetical protein